MVELVQIAEDVLEHLITLVPLQIVPGQKLFLKLVSNDQFLAKDNILAVLMKVDFESDTEELAVKIKSFKRPYNWLVACKVSLPFLKDTQIFPPPKVITRAIRDAFGTPCSLLANPKI